MCHTISRLIGRQNYTKKEKNAQSFSEDVLFWQENCCSPLKSWSSPLFSNEN
jgi:hypothetical protein